MKKQCIGSKSLLQRNRSGPGQKAVAQGSVLKGTVHSKELGAGPKERQGKKGAKAQR